MHELRAIQGENEEKRKNGGGGGGGEVGGGDSREWEDEGVIWKSFISRTLFILFIYFFFSFFRWMNRGNKCKSNYY